MVNTGLPPLVPDGPGRYRWTGSAVL